MTVVSDNFDRADTSTMTGYTELVGDWEVVSNKLQCNTDGGGTGYYLRNDTTVGSNDMYAQAVTSSAQANSSSNTGVLCRGQTGATNTSYQLATNHGADSWAIWRITAGSESQLLTGSAPIASGDTIRIEAAGSILRAKINGTLVGLVRDTTTSAGTRGGLNGYNAVGTDVVEIDNFETGALTDSPPGAPYVNGWSAQSSGTGTTQAPGVPANSIAAGVCVLAWVTSKDASQTVTEPAGEGWVLVENPSQTGLEGYLFAKIWGLAGQTDSSTPTFSIGSGTAGWLTTLQLVRNPAHDTNPWTSVASAIVASGSSSNAAASTVSAPSVSVSGSHLTVDRFYGSADDNALGGTISAGAGVLSLSGAAYDQTTGGGIAQASTVLEDTTIASSTGTATVTETVAGNDISNGVTLVFAIPASADGTATPTTVTASAALPAPSVLGVSSTTPAAVAAAVSLPAAAALGAATATAAVISTQGTVPAPAVLGQTVAQPSATAATATVATPGVSTGAGPAGIAAVCTLPGVTATGTAVVTPVVIAASLTIPPATAGSPATTQPATIIATVSLPAPSPSVSVAAQPGTVQLPAALLTPGASTGVTPGTIAAVAALPAPSISAGGSVSITPAAIQAFLSVLAPGLSTAVGPAAVSASASLPPPAVVGGTGATASPLSVAALVALPPPTASGESSGIAAPTAIALVALLPPVTASGGTGPEIVGRVVFITRATATVTSTTIARSSTEEVTTP